MNQKDYLSEKLHVVTTRSMRDHLLACQYSLIAYTPRLRQNVCRQVMVRKGVFQELPQMRMRMRLRLNCERWLSPSAKPISEEVCNLI